MREPSSGCSEVAGTPGEVGRAVTLIRGAAGGAGVLLPCRPSAEGVVASVGAGYLAHVREGDLELCRLDRCQPRIGQVVVGALDDASDEVVALSRRVLGAFARATGRECARRALLACASDDPEVPEAVHRYLRLGFSLPRELHARATDARVLAVDELARRVLGEVERTRQFARFSHLADGSWLAVVGPAADTVPLVARHFARRMGPERFCLVDPRHRSAAFHEAHAGDCAVVRLDEGLARRLVEREAEDLAADERYVRALWGRFYDRVSLPGRGAHARGYDLRSVHVPARHRARLPELDPRTREAPPPLRAPSSGRPREAEAGASRKLAPGQDPGPAVVREAREVTVREARARPGPDAAPGARRGREA